MFFSFSFSFLCFAFVFFGAGVAVVAFWMEEAERAMRSGPATGAVGRTCVRIPQHLSLENPAKFGQYQLAYLEGTKAG